MTRITNSTGGPAGGDLLTPAQAAAFLRVHPVDLLTAARKGHVPCRVHGHRVVFSRADLLAAMRTAAASGPACGEADDA